MKKNFYYLLITFILNELTHASALTNDADIHEGTKPFSFQEGILVGAEYKGEAISLISYQPGYSIHFNSYADRHKFHKILEAINFDSFDDPVKKSSPDVQAIYSKIFKEGPYDMPSRLENALLQLECIEPMIARELLDLCIQKIDDNVNSKRFDTLPGAEFYPEIISAVYGIFNALKNQI